MQAYDGFVHRGELQNNALHHKGPPPVQQSTDDVEDPEEAARMETAQNPVDTHTTIPLPGGSVWIDLDNTIDGARFVSTETKKKKVTH